MPPETTPLEISQRAYSLWRVLSSAYDEIEEALKSPVEEDLGELGRKIVQLEHELRPLVARIATLRTQLGEEESELVALWTASDEIIASLRHRQPALARAAIAARDGALAALSKQRHARVSRQAYVGAVGGRPTFTSQRA